MITILAEKPSVAKSIARIVGSTEVKSGYYHGNGYFVTWAFGHLVQLALPEDYGFKGHDETLPMFPKKFKLVPRQKKTPEGYKNDPAIVTQLNKIRKLFKDSTEIIVATDAGREGELIFRHIYHYLNCNVPFKRLWISSLTDKSIKDGLNNLRKGSDFDNLYLAAKARSEADWLVGMNASQALACKMEDKNNSLGRVQTPTLAMICKRYAENKNFVPEPFWTVSAKIEKDHILTEVIIAKPFDDKGEADRVYSRLSKDGMLTVKSVDKKEVKDNPPLLYDLTALQKEANQKFGFTADKTLRIAQKLYEARHITYPRTSSRYIPEDVFAELPVIADMVYNRQANHESVNDSKITDHHAIIVTNCFPDSLDDSEQKIYDMVKTRVMESFSGVCKKEISTVLFHCGDIELQLKGTVITEKGWRKILDEKPENEELKEIPAFAEGEVYQVKGLNCLQKKTKPKPIYTDAGVLTAMETCGRELDEDQRKILKDCGIGTPATRAGVIETLIARDYISRNNKQLVPTAKGMAIYKVVKTMKIANVELTAEWELGLAKIERDSDFVPTFNEALIIHTQQITNEIQSLEIEADTSGKVSCICPKCKRGMIIFYSKILKCNNSKCNHTIYRIVAGKLLTDQQLQTLMKKGETDLIKGFKKKDKTTFDTKLMLTEEKNIAFMSNAK